MDRAAPAPSAPAGRRGSLPRGMLSRPGWTTSRSHQGPAPYAVRAPGPWLISVTGTQAGLPTDRADAVTRGRCRFAVGLQVRIQAVNMLYGQTLESHGTKRRL